MKICSLTLKNIKSFNEEQTIVFNDTLNIFVGKNGSGKSTIINIIKILTNFPMLKHSNYLRTLEKITIIKNQNNNSQPFIGLKVCFFKSDFENFNNIYETFQNYKLDKTKIKWFENKLKQAKKLLDQELNFSGDSFEIDLQYNFKNKRLEAKSKENRNKFFAILKIFSIKHNFLSKQILEECYEQSRDDRGGIFLPKTQCLSPTISVSFKKFNNGFQEFDKKYYYLYENECKGDLIGSVMFIQHDSENKTTVAESSAWKHFSKIYIPENDIEVKTFDKNPNMKIPDCFPIDNLGKYSSNNNYKRSVLINEASDGEYCLLNQQLLHSYDLKNIIIFIDEPEVHVHPQAQKQFLNELKNIEKNTKSQIFMSTHSPILIDGETIPSSYRVFFDKKQQSSQIRKFKKNNSKNNKIEEFVNLDFAEKALFANKVVLVEGQSDKAFFEILLKYKKEENSDLIEIISTNGKHNFEHYKKLLELLQFEDRDIFTIADIDYIEQIGSKNIKKIIKDNTNKAKCIKEIKELLSSKSSKDKNKLYDILSKLLEDPQNVIYQDCFKSLWEYIVNKNNKPNWDSIIKDTVFEEELKNQSEKNIFILSKGELEYYLKNLIIEENDIYIDFKNCLGEDKKASSSLIKTNINTFNKVQAFFKKYPELENICNKIIYS